MDIVRGFEEGGIFRNVLVLLMDLIYQLLPQHTVPDCYNHKGFHSIVLQWTTYIDF